MFLQLEDESLINVELIDRVELNHQDHKKMATLYVGGTLTFADSRIAYRYFMQDSVRVTAPEEKKA